MINTVSFDVFMPDLEPELVRCPVPVIERRLRESAIEACEDANVWREEISVEVVPDVTQYAFLDEEQADDVQIHSILWMNLNGRPMAHGCDYTVEDRGTFTLLRNPKATATMTALISLKPSRETLVLGDVLYRDYHKMILQGTLAKAYGMDKRQWSNPTKEAQCRVVFEEEIADAKRAIDRGFVTGSQRLRSRPFAMPVQSSFGRRF